MSSNPWYDILRSPSSGRGLRRVGPDRRFSGKRTLGTLDAVDLVVSVALGSGDRG